MLPVSLRFNYTPSAAPKDPGPSVTAGADGPLRCLDGADTVEAGSDGPMRCLDGADTESGASSSWGGWNIAS